METKIILNFDVDVFEKAEEGERAAREIQRPVPPAALRRGRSVRQANDGTGARLAGNRTGPRQDPDDACRGQQPLDQR